MMAARAKRTLDVDELAAWYADPDHYDPRVLAFLAHAAELERLLFEEMGLADVSKVLDAGDSRDDDNETDKEAES